VLFRAHTDLSVAEAPPVDAGAAASTVTSDIAAAAAFSVDPFANLLDDVDDRLAAATKGATNTPNFHSTRARCVFFTYRHAVLCAGSDAAPLCAEAAVVWNVGAGGVAPLMGTPPVESVLAAAAAASSASSQQPPDNVALLLEEARQRLAAVRLPPATWGPGSSLSPRQSPAAAFAAAPPPTAAPSASGLDGWGAFSAVPAPAEGPGERSLIDL
jgi:hypothetical protein